MALVPGTRLGPYEITGPIDAGGMGEVYRARDTRLARDVAIKVLPAAFTADPARRVRFDREARLLASLNHPNIATIHGVEDADGVEAIVLELVQGETLRERLLRGPLASAEALRHAAAIADALEAAHERGIIHRDLKPGNVMITASGTVKVLDFGIAKVTLATGAGQDFPQSRTMTVGGNEDGQMAGTAAYMSPEQTRAQAVDKRADIWAFGCVLYEMLSGRQAFGADTLTDVIARILERDPDFTCLPGATPSSVRTLIRHCLQKELRRRLHDIGDARLALEDALSRPAIEVPEAGRQTNRRVVWLVAAVMIISTLVTAAFVRWLRPTATPNAGVVRFTMEPPSMPNPYAFSLSPDGRTVAFVARQSDGRRALFVRSVSEIAARALPGTEYASGVPFWSPDNRRVGFAAGSDVRQLKIVAVDGGRPHVVCDLLRGNPFMGTWNSSDDIVFVDDEHGALFRVAAKGGTPVRLTTPARHRPESGHLFPQFLPDGRRYLYLSRYADSNGHAVSIGSLDSPDAIRLMGSESMAYFAPPRFLLFARGRTLLAQEFDPSTTRLTGEPVSIGESVLYRADMGRAAFAVSEGGTLVYRMGGTETGQRSLVWVDRNGTTSGVGAPIWSTNIRLSPDGKRIAFAHGPTGEALDVWIGDLLGNVRFPVTNHPAIDHTPVWSPDGVQVAFDSHRGSGGSLHETRADGSSADRELLPAEAGVDVALLDWTSEYILFSKRLSDGMHELWAWKMSDDRRPFRYLSRATNAALAPDGRRVAYVIDEGGTSQVVVQSFPDPSKGRQRISSSGGTLPRWRRDGRELYYLDLDWNLMAVPVDAGGTADIGNSRTLFTPPGFAPPPNVVGYSYDVTPDGQRFLFSVASGALEAAPIIVVMNWQEAVRRASRPNWLDKPYQ